MDDCRGIARGHREGVPDRFRPQRTSGLLVRYGVADLHDRRIVHAGENAADGVRDSQFGEPDGALRKLIAQRVIRAEVGQQPGEIKWWCLAFHDGWWIGRVYAALE